MLVALYPRVSTQEQIEGYSIGEQTERMRKYCDAMGWTVYNVYTDAGFSGANTDRPALQRMIKDIQQHKIDKVLVYKLDRLSRSQLDTLYLIEKVFLANGCDFVSMNENFDTSTPFGRAMIGILAVFAQLEREQIKERMTMGLDARAKEGKYHGSSTIPIGYDYVDGALVVNEFEAMQVVKAHELYLSGMGIQAICDQFNESGLIHKHGKWWSLTMRNVLGKKTYLGYVYWKGNWYKGVHEPIVSQELFDRVTELKDNKHKNYLDHNRRTGMASSYLGGFVYCARCGAKYIKCAHYNTFKDRREVVPLYKCSSRAKKTKASVVDPNCRNKIWGMDELNNLIFDEIRKLKIEPYEPLPVQDETPVITAEIAKLDEQIARLMDLYSVGEMPLEILQSRIHDLNDRKTKLESELDKPADKGIPVDHAIEYAQLFDEILDSGDLATIRNVIGILINKIVVDGDDITIHWNFMP